MPQDFFYYDPSQKPVAGTPLDLDHWASNATALYPMWEGGGQSVEDIVNGFAGTLSGNVSWNSLGLSFPGGSSDYLQASPTMPQAGAIEIWVSFTHASNYIGILGWASISSSLNGITLEFDSTGTVSTNIKNSGGYVYSASTGMSINDGKLHQIVVSWSSQASGGTINTYIDGNLVISGTTTGAWSLTNPLRIGRTLDGFWQPFTGSVAKAVIYSIVPNADQVNALYERPYEMFVQKRFPLHGRKSTVLRPRGPTWRSLSAGADDTQKPEAGTEVNLDHWASNATAFWPMWEGSGQSAEETMGSYNGVVGSDLSWQYNDRGVLLRGNGGTNGHLDTQWLGITGTGPKYVSLRFRIFGGVSLAGLIGWGNQNSACMNLQVESGVLWLRMNNGVVASWSSGLNDGNWHHVLYQIPDGSVHNTAVVYVDGVFAPGTFQTGTHVNNLIADTSHPVTIFRSWHPSGVPLNGDMESVVLGQAFLAPEQVKELYERPYALFKPHRFGSSASPVAAKAYVSSNRKIVLSDATQKPEAGSPLSLDHWASKALAIWPMWEGAGGQSEDIVGIRNASLNSGVSFSSDGLVFNGTTGIATINGNIPASSTITLWAWINVGATGAIQHINSNDNGTSATSRIWQFRLRADGTFQSIFFTTGNTLGQAVGSVVVAGTGPHLVAVTWDGTTIRNYVDGIPDGTGSLSGIPTNVPTTASTIGNGISVGQSGTAPLKGTIYQHGILYSVLTPEQIKELYERPYEMFSQSLRGRSILSPLASLTNVICDMILEMTNLGSLQTDLNLPSSPIEGVLLDSVYNTYSLGPIQLDSIYTTNYLISILEDGGFDVDWTRLAGLATKIFVLDAQNRTWTIDAMNRTWTLDSINKTWSF